MQTLMLEDQHGIWSERRKAYGERCKNNKATNDPQASEFAHDFLRLPVSFCQPCVDAYLVAVSQNSEVQVWKL